MATNVILVGFGFGLFFLSVSLPSESAAINILGFDFGFAEKDEDIRKDLFYMNGEISPFDISKVGKPVPVHTHKEGCPSLKDSCTNIRCEKGFRATIVKDNDDCSVCSCVEGDKKSEL